MEEIQRRQNEVNMIGQAGNEQHQTHQDHITGQEAEQSQDQVGTDLAGDIGEYNIEYLNDDTYAQPGSMNITLPIAPVSVIGNIRF